MGLGGGGDNIICAVALTLDLSVLVVFKYYDFFISSFTSLLNSFGYYPSVVSLNLILPVGISFYTFQAVGYIIDVYKGKLKASGNFIQFLTYISFFPQLVAGPIERASALLPQFAAPRKFDYQSAKVAMRLILWGFFKKVAVADNAAAIVDPIFENYQSYDSLSLLVAAVLFSIQIYCDFSAYSDIAIGSARLFGIRLSTNFNFPYFSRNIMEFWKKWHISLTSWFRDYVYIPLGGSRCSRYKHIRNVFIVFLVSGLWHGANYTFIVWGLYHAALFIPLIFIKPQLSALPRLRDMWRILLTFGLATIGWIIFRSASMGDAVGYISAMITNYNMPLKFIGKIAIALSGVMFLVEWFSIRMNGEVNPDNILMISRYRAVRWILYLGLLALIFSFMSNPSQFIYFQF